MELSNASGRGGRAARGLNFGHSLYRLKSNFHPPERGYEPTYFSVTENCTFKKIVPQLSVNFRQLLNDLYMLLLLNIYFTTLNKILTEIISII